MSPPHRILVTSHSHPHFNAGGGEIAAYNLFRAYGGLPEVEQAFFLARHDRSRGAVGAISPRGPNEYLWEQSVGDWFRMTAAHDESLHRNFSDLLRALRPTVVHAHHYVHMGLEYLQVIRRHDPDVRILMTLHEYIAICANNGQMVKAGSTALCHRESPDDCRRCFPERGIEDFWLRKHRFRRYFDLVDMFIAPSEFLRGRYIDWGLPPERIVTIENGQEPREPLPPRPLQAAETRNRFGFFGQITPFKGVDVLLQALTTLPRKARRRIVLEINGANLEQQKPEFRERIEALRAPLEKEGVLQWNGPYEPFQMSSRLASVDWVTVPSIWWENSPMVIQEAFAHGRPVIGSDIGGMAEKIADGVNGRQVPVGNAHAWAQTMSRLAGDTDEWDRLRDGIRPPMSYAECAGAHLELVGDIRGTRSPAKITQTQVAKRQSKNAPNNSRSPVDS